MGLFRREPADYEERRRLERLLEADALDDDHDLRRFMVLAQERKDLLSAACVNQVMHTAGAQADQYGVPLTSASGMDMALARVEDVVWQDRSLYAWVARDVLLNLHLLLDNRFDGPPTEGLEAAVQSVGLSGVGGGLSDAARRLDGPEQAEVLRYGEQALDVYHAIPLRDRPPPRDREAYDRLFRSSPAEVEWQALQIVAWCCIVICRLCASGRMEPTILMGDPDFDLPPPMDKRGWYPNPYNRGRKGLIPRLERYWDGYDWTDQFRAREEWGWEYSSVPLRTVPSN